MKPGTGRSSVAYRAWSASVLGIFAIVVILPLVHALWNSVRSDGGFTIEGYRAVLTEARQWSLLANSLIVAGGAALCATVLGVPAAFALERSPRPLRGLLSCGIALPFLIPTYVSAIAWIDVLGKNGLLHKLFAVFGLDVVPPSVSTRPGVVFVYALAYYPIVTLTTVLALRRFDRRFEEAARLAAPSARTFRAILLPLLAPSIAAGSLIVFLMALVGFAAPSLLQVDVYPVEIFTSFSAFYDVPAATAQALPLILCGFAALAVAALYIGPRHGWLTGRAKDRLASRRPRFAGQAFLFVLVVVSGVLPLAVIIWRSLPLRSYLDVFATAREEILTSALTAAAAATVIVVFAFSLACRQHAQQTQQPRSARRGRVFPGAARFLSLLPFLVSGPVIGIALIGAWNRPWVGPVVYDTVLVIILACVARFLFFAHHSFGAALGDLHPNLEEAAHVAGVPRFRQIAGIVVPLMWPVIAGVWGLSFMLCMAELDATALVCPPGATTLPVRIFSLMHYGPNRLVAALSVITTFTILICAAVTAALYAKGKRIRHARG